VFSSLWWRFARGLLFTAVICVILFLSFNCIVVDSTVVGSVMCWWVIFFRIRIAVPPEEGAVGLVYMIIWY